VRRIPEFLLDKNIPCCDSPLTPALSPLRGEGDHMAAFLAHFPAKVPDRLQAPSSKASLCDKPLNIPGFASGAAVARQAPTAFDLITASAPAS
jgi:hypothetical protein